MEKSGELFFIYQKGGVEVEKGGENRIVSAKVLELVTLVLQEPTGAPAVGWARKPSPNRRSTPIERRRDPNREGFGMTRSGLCGLPPDAAADVARIVKAKHTDANVHARYNWGSLAPATVNLFTGPGSQPHRKVADMWRWLLKNEHGDWRAALGGIERSSASRPPPPPPPPPPVDHQIRELEQALRERERDMLAREQQERQLRQQLHDACRERDDSRRERDDARRERDTRRERDDARRERDIARGERDALKIQRDVWKSRAECAEEKLRAFERRAVDPKTQRNQPEKPTQMTSEAPRRIEVFEDEDVADSLRDTPYEETLSGKRHTVLALGDYYDDLGRDMFRIFPGCRYLPDLLETGQAVLVDPDRFRKGVAEFRAVCTRRGIEVIVDP